MRLASAALPGALVLSAALAAQPMPPATEMTAPQLAAAVQRRYDSIRDFTAEFTQSYRGGVLNRQLTEKGRVVIKKPGKMRWEYTAPEKKLFVSDGVKVYSYVPEDRQVLVSSVPDTDDASTPALFLAGKGNVIRDFEPSHVDVPAGFPTGTRALKLAPKTSQPDYDWLVLALDPTTLAFRGLVTMDTQGGTSTFSFVNLKENVGVADKEFVFRIPRGVDVVTDSSAR